MKQVAISYRRRVVLFLVLVAGTSAQYIDSSDKQIVLDWISYVMTIPFIFNTFTLSWTAPDPPTSNGAEKH
jgi:uncharacterized membrane-anchored protein